MKIVIPGGTGHVGAVLKRHFESAGDEVVILSRHEGVKWDGETLGPWTREIDGADVVINLAGRSVDCRYNDANLADMMNSRVNSTRVVGEAIRQAAKPPKVWLQSSTATIYAHRFDAPNDDETGILGGDEPNAPRTWRASIAIAKAWEKTLDEADTPHTRKVAMRSAMTMSIDKGSVFDALCRIVRLGLGGPLAGGRQYVSWIHEHDFSRAVDFLIAREELRGPINLSSPNPLPYAEFMHVLRKELRVPIGLPATAWMVEVGTWLRRTESELVLKSRRVVPSLLLRSGFQFEYANWSDAARELVSRAASGSTTSVGAS